ncbi:hypothetical protein PG984_005531 [Apiospora sp. TS-2023a]
MVLVELGAFVCAPARSSIAFILGRVVNGIGSAGLISGALLIIGFICKPRIRPAIPEIGNKLSTVDALRALPRSLDPVGFVPFGSGLAMLLIAITRGGGQLPWSSPTTIAYFAVVPP